MTMATSHRIAHLDDRDRSGTLLVSARIVCMHPLGTAVDEAMRTSDPLIYAVGHAVEKNAIIKVFDKVVALTGWNENACPSADRRYLAVHTHPTSHAGYYPRRFSTWLLKA